MSKTAYNYKNIAQAKAIEYKNKEMLKKKFPALNDKGGIYFLTRTDENGFKYAYIGQANASNGILGRLAQHLVGYKQHIDLSLKKHKLYDEKDNPYGWKIGCVNYLDRQLDEMEKYWIKEYALQGYQMRNKTIGSQGKGKDQLSDFKPAKTYREGLVQGYCNASKEIAHLFDLHLDVKFKNDKIGKNAEKALDKFNNFLSYHNNSQD